MLAREPQATLFETRTVQRDESCPSVETNLPLNYMVLEAPPIVGKSVFLYVLLVLRLQARLPTIYQSRDSHLYYFADNGVFLILTQVLNTRTLGSQLHPSTWCLIDSDSLGTVPVFIRDLRLFIVQASSTLFQMDG